MKKIVAILWLLSCSVIALAQSSQIIDYDGFTSDGTRQVMSSSRTFYLSNGAYGTKYYFRIKAFATNNDTTYALVISSYSSIPSNAELLLKSESGDIVSLIANNVTVSEVEQPTHSYLSGNTITTMPSPKMNYYISVFKLSMSDIQLIQRKKITKIRLSSSTGYVDISYKRDYFGRWSRYAIEEVHSRLVNVKKDTRQDIYEGF
ncbi:MAG: hypothetical protein MJZ14_00170 [Paludibacteraceae bacterium]|nr:hypothetical protein [Paludibacteraceae bacterium]